MAWMTIQVSLFKRATIDSIENGNCVCDAVTMHLVPVTGKSNLGSCTLGLFQEVSTVYGKCRLSRHILSSPARGGRIFSSR